jgi:hypothetical protein
MKTTGSRPDSRISAASTSNSADDTHTSSSLGKSRTIPTCARCRNHFEIVPVKGHKRICSHRYCLCLKCRVLEESRRLRAIELKIRRDDYKLRKAVWKTYGDTSYGTKSSKRRKKATPSAPGTDSNAVVESGVRPLLRGGYSAQNPSNSPAPNVISNIIPPPQPQHQLARRDHQDSESYMPLNTADTIVEERTESVSTGNISGKTQPVATRFSTTPHQRQSYWSQFSSRTQPIAPTTWMANIIPPPEPKLQLSSPYDERFTNSGLPSCCHSFTNDVPQSQTATPTNSRVTNVPSVCIYTAGITVSPRIAEAPGTTDFRSIESLSSSTSNTSRTPPGTLCSWTNEADTSIPTQQSVMLPSHYTCGNYDNLIRQHHLNSQYLSRNNGIRPYPYVQCNSSFLLC